MDYKVLAGGFMGSLTHAIILYDRACREFDRTDESIAYRMGHVMRHLESVVDKELPPSILIKHRALMDDLKQYTPIEENGVIGANVKNFNLEDLEEKRNIIKRIHAELKEAKEQSTPKRR